MEYTGVLLSDLLKKGRKIYIALAQEECLMIL